MCIRDREKTWRLNEKHYGMLQGLNKAETAEKYGDEQVLIWRRSYDVPPTPLAKDDPRSPFVDARYKGEMCIRDRSKRLPDMTEDEQFALLATDGMLVKRPILVGEDFVLVGFKEADWERCV